MELWIRSQDKEFLTLAQQLDIYNGTLPDDEKENWYIEESGNDIGEYTTRERALEVLDEIQDEIQYFDSEKYTGNKTTIVYEMPKE